MLLMCLSDMHLRASNPENRIDDFPGVQFEKVNWILEYAEQNKIEYILDAGDIFHTANQPYSLVQLYIRLFLTARIKGIKHLAVPGQHDMRFHSQDLTNTPFAVLEAAGVIDRLGSDPYFLSEDIHVYGAGFEEEIPKVEDTDAYNILVTHRLVVHEKLWTGQEGEEKANILLLKNPDYDLIVSGDNHQTLWSECDGGILINSGSLMRSKTDQVDHKPCFFLVDTDSHTYNQIYIPVRESSRVFNLDKVEQKKSESKELDAFIEDLKKSSPFLQDKNTGFVAELKRDAKTKLDGLEQEILQEIINEQ